jgi:protoheme IX farnesyltransferase
MIRRRACELVAQYSSPCKEAGGGASRGGLGALGKWASTSSGTASRASRASRASTARTSSRWRDYKQLSKLRLSGLVTATAAAGFVAASTEDIDWSACGWTSLGTMLCSSSANALNQLYEVSNDSRMSRTAVRPLPQGRMSRGHALAFALMTGGAGVWVLLNKVNSTTAMLGAGNIALYSLVYTPLKQLSIANTWVGAVVGAIPPLMGWAGALGELDAGAFLLSAGLYFWQMPHFMALAWMCRKDYAAGGYKMLSLVDPSGKRTASCAIRNCLYLFPLGALSTWLGITSPYFAYESAFITAGMLLTAANFYAKPSNGNARILFRASLLHLPVFMGAFLLHRIPNTGAERKDVLMEHLRLLLGREHRDQEEGIIQHPSIYRERKERSGQWEHRILNPYIFPTPSAVPLKDRSKLEKE